MNVQRFTYNPQRYLPFIPMTLFYEEISIEKEALVDSGATNNVLPYHVGLELGLSWEAQTRKLTPVDILRGAPVVGIRLYGQIKPFPLVPLVFAWTQKNDIPLILGHVNFFGEFDVHFYDTQGFFELRPGKRF
ncbi:hypothetical protein U27_01391 [Candidatus Vecturithrix granuli]|uniref:Peptidase A2 domain-containing protein n=1 Tax=Vecturithrix granuli TaxID=1499967 RepID=A0A081CA85_VECG1|nr:hypothetical protein U27_01391 [Candidatus Vecturithrix granuli]